MSLATLIQISDDDGSVTEEGGAENELCRGAAQGSPGNSNWRQQKQRATGNNLSPTAAGETTPNNNRFNISTTRTSHSRNNTTDGTNATTTTAFPGSGSGDGGDAVMGGESQEDEPKVCPMCNQTFTSEVTQYLFENHVVAHFDEIDVGFEVV